MSVLHSLEGGVLLLSSPITVRFARRLVTFACILFAKGFVSNMDEWMGAVDCIVTKAGPGTIAEAMTRGLPIMLSAFLPGQEVSKGVAIALFRPSPLSLIVCASIVGMYKHMESSLEHREHCQQRR